MPDPIRTRRLDLPPVRMAPRRRVDLVGRTKFTDTAAWRKLRAEFLRVNPLCFDCDANGRTVPALEVHHIRKRADDPGREQWLDPENLMSLCRPCHSRRTARGE